MKSIADWRKDKELEKELHEALGDMPNSVNMSSVRNVFGGSKTSKVDPQLRTTLRTKILQIAKDHPELNPLNLFREIMKVVGMLIWKLSGNSFSVSRFASSANMDQNEWAVIRSVVEELDPALTIRTAGQRLDTETDIKSILKTAYDRIKKIDEYENMPVDELFEKMRSALMLLAADIKSTTAPTRTAVNKINDDPVAREVH